MLLASIKRPILLDSLTKHYQLLDALDGFALLYQELFLTVTNDNSPILINLLEGNIVNLNNNNQENITLDIHGLPEVDFAKGQVTLYAVQSTSSTNITVKVNGNASTLQGSPPTLRDGSHIIIIDLFKNMIS